MQIILVHITFIPFFSICGFKDAYTYSCITDQVVDMVQSYIRSKMEGFLSKMKMETTDRGDFFGESKKDPGSFEFSIGERVLILSISNHVKQIVSKTDSTISHFYSRGGGNYEDAADLLWYSEANGYFFTNTRASITHKTSQLDKDSLKNKLLKQIQGKIAAISYGSFLSK